MRTLLTITLLLVLAPVASAQRLTQAQVRALADKGAVFPPSVEAQIFDCRTDVKCFPVCARLVGCHLVATEEDGKLTVHDRILAAKHTKPGDCWQRVSDGQSVTITRRALRTLYYTEKGRVHARSESAFARRFKPCK